MQNWFYNFDCSLGSAEAGLDPCCWQKNSERNGFDEGVRRTTARLFEDLAHWGSNHTGKIIDGKKRKSAKIVSTGTGKKPRRKRRKKKMTWRGKILNCPEKLGELKDHQNPLHPRAKNWHWGEDDQKKKTKREKSSQGGISDITEKLRIHLFRRWIILNTSVASVQRGSAADRSICIRVSFYRLHALAWGHDWDHGKRWMKIDWE